MANRDQNRWRDYRESRETGERRPWEGYRRSDGQAPDYGSAGGQYTSRVGPDQNPYTEDEGAYAGARSRDLRGQGNYEKGVQRDWEREGRGAGGGYGQVGGSRETARDEGGYSRASRAGGQRHYGQGGYGEEQDWGRDRGDFNQYGQGRFDAAHGNPPDAGQLAYGAGSQNYGQTVSGSDGGAHSDRGRHEAHDSDYRQWRSEQARKYDEDYGSWRNSQLRKHDEDYAKWRTERRDKFGKDFSDWSEQNRSASDSAGPQSGARPLTEKGVKH